MDYLDSVYSSLSADGSDALIWGIFTRFYGLIYFIALFPFAIQLPALAGKHGLTPYTTLLQCYWRDFGISALWRVPSLYWFSLPLPSISESLLVALPFTAAIFGLLIFFGIGYTPYLIAFCWITLISIDNGASALMFPWDSVLLESSFLALFLPALPPLLSSAPFSSGASTLPAALSSLPLSPSVAQTLATVSDTAQVIPSAFSCGLSKIGAIEGAACDSLRWNFASSAVPNPMLAFAFRYLVVRLLVGFGKIKFMGTTDKDKYYIKYFLINQPIVTPIGWFMYHLMPNIGWVISLLVMFIVEIPLPFLAFIPGWCRLSFAFGNIALMFGIMLAGNYGYFNVLTIVLSIPLLVPEGTLFDTPASIFTGGGSNAVFAYIAACYIFPASLLYFAMNSWINLSWTYWPTLKTFSPTLITEKLIGALRFLAPLRLVQAYGVFPPNSAPPQRWLVQYETLAEDGTTWKPFRLPHVAFAPTLLAPYHARVDHAIFYESLGMNGSNFMGLLVHPNPYGFSFVSAWVQLQMILAKAVALGQSSKDIPILDRFQIIPSTTPGIKLADGSVLGIYEKEVLPSGAVSPNWRCIGKSAPVRVRLVNAVPANLSTWAGRAWKALKGHREPGVGLIGQLQVSAWDFKDSGSHIAPLVAFRAWENPKTREVHVAEDEYTHTLHEQHFAAGPEDFWWESVFHRHAAENTNGTVSAGEYKQFWEFIDFARKAAQEACGTRLAAPISSRKTNLTPVRGSMFAIKDIVAASFYSPTTGKEALQKAVRAALPKVTDHMDLDVANATFVWRSMPAVAKAMFEKYSDSQLATLRKTFSKLCIPVLRTCERLCWRALPNDAALAAEWQRKTMAFHAAASAPRSTSSKRRRPSDAGDVADAHKHTAATDVEGVQAYLNLRQMTGNAAKRPEPSPAFVPAASVQYYRAEFIENEGSLDGCLNSPVKYGMYAAWLMLVGGRHAYETAAAHDEWNILDKKLPTGFTGLGATDYIGNAPLADLFCRLVQSDAVHPSQMGDEAGTFLLCLLNYDMFATVAQRAKMMALQGRPKSGPLDEPPRFLPGFIQFIQRMSIHDELVPWDHLNKRFADNIETPNWGLDVDAGTWHLLQQ